MQKLLKYSFVALLFIVTECQQQCTTVMGDYNLYPALLERFTQDISFLFKGQQLSYSSDAPLEFQVLNYNNPVDSGSRLPQSYEFIASGVLLKQVSQEWDGICGLLAKQPSQTAVFVSKFTPKQSPKFEVPITLLMGQNDTTCISITFISRDFLVVDCYMNRDDGYMQNQWQIVNIKNPYGLPKVVNYSSSQQLQSHTMLQQGHGRVTHFWQNATSGDSFLFQGTLFNDETSFLDVFKITEYVPNNEPYASLSESGLQIRDIEVTPNGQIWVLQSTQLLIYTLDQWRGTLSYLKEFKLNNNTNYLSVFVGVDFRFPQSDTFTVLLSTTASKSNIEEFVVMADTKIIQTGYYTVPVQLEYHATPPILDLNIYYVVVQYNGSFYAFERGVPDYTDTDYKQFYQSNIIFTGAANWIDLNRVPETLLLISDSVAQISLLSTPALTCFLQTELADPVSFTLNASNNVSTCSTNITFKTVTSAELSIYKASSFASLPSSAIYPVNVTINMAQYAIGPTLSVSGQFSTLNEGSSSSIVQTTINKIKLNVDGYPTSGNLVFVKNFYEFTSNANLQLLQQLSLRLTAYVCQQSVFGTGQTCQNVGHLKMNSTIRKIATMYTTSQQSSSYLIISDASQNLLVCQLTWNLQSQQGGFSPLYSLSFQVDEYNLDPTDFEVFGDRLFVVIAEIHQLWVYSLSTETARFIYKITLQTLRPFVTDFFPIAVVGDYSTYGPIIFINNQMNVLLLQTSGDSPVYMTSIPLQGAAQTTSKLLIVGDSLISAEFNKLSQTTTLIQYSLENINDPTKVKAIPHPPNIAFSLPLQIVSDDYFLYALMATNVINVYKPALSTHQVLFQEIKLNSKAGHIIFSAASTRSYSNLLVSDQSQTSNWEIALDPTVVLIPGSYKNQYSTTTQYTLEVTNSFNATPLGFLQKIQIYNTQLEIYIDESKIENHGIIKVPFGQNTTRLDPTLFISGNVAEYKLESGLTISGNISLRNRLYLAKSSFITIQDVEAFASIPGKQTTLIQSKDQLYSMNSDEQVKSVYTFPPDHFQNCPLITAAQDIAVSFCEPASGLGLKIVMLNTTTQPYSEITTHFSPNLENPTQAQVLGNMIFTLSVNTDEANVPTIQVLQYMDIGFPLYKSISCDGSTNIGINGFALTALKKNGNLTTYVLMYSCMDNQQGVLYSSFYLDTSRNIVEAFSSAASLNVKTPQYQLLPDTQFQQIIVVPNRHYEISTLNLIITTSNLISFAFQYRYRVETDGSNVVNFLDQVVVATLPSYGVWTSFNVATYANGLLGLTYADSKTKRSFLQVFDMSGFNWSQPISTPYYMFGGYYQLSYVDTNNTLNSVPYFIHEGAQTDGFPETFILTVNQKGQLNQIGISELLHIKSNIEAPFQIDQGIFTASNAYLSSQFNIDFAYDGSTDDGSSDGLDWWAWVLISLAVVVVVLLGVAAIRRRRNKQAIIILSPEESIVDEIVMQNEDGTQLLP